MAEYINMITVSAVASTLFLGGWSFFGLERIPLLSILFFLIKVAIFLFMFIWLRATLPRIRYDRLMRLGWQTLLPLAVLNIVITAIIVALLPRSYWWVNGLIGLLVVAIVLWAVRRKSIVEKTRFEQKSTEGAVLMPASVRLARFEPISAPVSDTAQEQKAVQA
jgi:NADH-quinone oxidoreductase subunit H